MAIIYYILNWIKFAKVFIRALKLSEPNKTLEIVKLQSQLMLYEYALYQEKIKKPKATVAFRQLWSFLCRYYSNWKVNLVVFKPETVIRWYRDTTNLWWKLKSRKVGRPKTSKEVIDKIREFQRDNPYLSAEKIYEMLISLGIEGVPCPNTIRKYMVKNNKNPNKNTSQQWKTFLANHRKDIWAMDFLVLPRLMKPALYVLLVINHGTRKIEHFGVTIHPNAGWVEQEIRNATPYGHQPKYLIHDNDNAFRAKSFQSFLKKAKIKSVRTAYRSPWQNGIAERVIGIYKRELYDHFIPINEGQITQLTKDFTDNYYNTHRTHQGINCKTPIPLPEYKKTGLLKTKFIKTKILGGLYHTYDKIA